MWANYSYEIGILDNELLMLNSNTWNPLSEYKQID